MARSKSKVVSERVQGFIGAGGEVKRFKSPYDRQRVISVIHGESMTHQDHAESCNINVIVNQFARTGIIPPDPRGRVPQYGDVSHLNEDLTSLINTARDGNLARAEILSKREAAKAKQLAAEKAELEQLRREKAATPPVAPT